MSVPRVLNPGLLRAIKLAEEDTGMSIDRGYAARIVVRYLQLRELRAHEEFSKEDLLAVLTEEIERDQKCPGPYRLLVELYFD